MAGDEIIIDDAPAVPLTVLSTGIYFIVYERIYCKVKEILCDCCNNLFLSLVKRHYLSVEKHNLSIDRSSMKILSRYTVSIKTYRI